MNSTGGQRRFETLRSVLRGVYPEAGRPDRPAVLSLTPGGAAAQRLLRPTSRRRRTRSRFLRGRASTSPRSPVSAAWLTGGRWSRTAGRFAFPRGLVTPSIFHVLFGHSQNLLGEMSARVLCPLGKEFGWLCGVFGCFFCLFVVVEFRNYHVSNQKRDLKIFSPILWVVLSLCG